MTEQTETWAASGPAGNPEAPPFVRLIEMHRSMAHGYRRAAYILVGIGAAIMLAGLAAGGWTWLSALGAVAVLAAVIPWKKHTEHRDRAEGLTVLHEEWSEASSGPEIDRLRSLIASLYGATPIPRPEAASP